MSTMELKRLAIGRLPDASEQANTAIEPTMPNTAVFLSLCALSVTLIGLYRIDFYSLWLDEYSTLMASSDWKILAGYLKTFPEQHPLYYFLIKILGVNHTLLEIRLFSLLCSVLAIFALHYIGRRVFSTGTARTACVFFALSPFVLYYSQEGRMYSLLVLLALIQTGLLVHALASIDSRCCKMVSTTTRPADSARWLSSRRLCFPLHAERNDARCGST